MKQYAHLLLPALFLSSTLHAMDQMAMMLREKEPRDARERDNKNLPVAHVYLRLLQKKASAQEYMAISNGTFKFQEHLKRTGVMVWNLKKDDLGKVPPGGQFLNIDDTRGSVNPATRQFSLGFSYALRAGEYKKLSTEAVTVPLGWMLTKQVPREIYGSDNLYVQIESACDRVTECHTITDDASSSSTSSALPTPVPIVFITLKILKDDKISTQVSCCQATCTQDAAGKTVTNMQRPLGIYNEGGPSEQDLRVQESLSLDPHAKQISLPVSYMDFAETVIMPIGWNACKKIPHSSLVMSIDTSYEPSSSQ